jgi:hypothetical protein
MLEILFLFYNIINLIFSKIKNKRFDFNNVFNIEFNHFINTYRLNNHKSKVITIFIFIDSSLSVDTINYLKTYYSECFFNIILISSEKMNDDIIFLPSHISLCNVKNIIDLFQPDMLINCSKNINFYLFYIFNKYKKKIIFFNITDYNFLNYFKTLYLKNFSDKYFDVMKEQEILLIHLSQFFT